MRPFYAIPTAGNPVPNLPQQKLRMIAPASRMKRGSAENGLGRRLPVSQKSSTEIQAILATLIEK